MRAIRGILLTLVLVAFGGALAGCESMENFTFWDTKKKLTGVRKPVFPEGVPGVEQGIPAELVKGYQEPAQPGVDPAAQAAQATADKEETKKPEAKPKPKPKVARPRPQPQPAQAQPAAWPAQQSAPPQQGQAAWPTQQQQAPPPQQTAPWPGSQPQQPQAQQGAPWPTAR
jgi:hypothetical protein